MKLSILLSSAILSFALVGCGSRGQLALPEQNIAARFELEGRSDRSWRWTEIGSPAVLSLEEQGSHELLWCIREKPRADRRRTSRSSLLLSPPVPARGPRGLSEVRFSPSGTTILVQERSRDGRRFQTLLFFQDQRTGAWFSRALSLTEETETSLRKLDDRSRVPIVAEDSIQAKILRLDDNLVIYKIGKKTRSLSL